ncbi:MAG: glycosyltransferase [Bradymonadales bacterium]|nr:glycosyltransferase [Bradymonadales bacterium]
MQHEAQQEPKLPPRPRICIVSDLFLPGLKGGGPIRSLANLVDHLEADFEFFVVTRDRDHLAREPYPEIEVDRWIDRPIYQVRYVSPRRWTAGGLRSILKGLRYDLLYLPSFFARSTIKILAMRRLGMLPDSAVVVAPRGQFHQAALGTKGVRKRCYLSLVRRLGGLKGVLIHATNPVEAEESRTLTGQAVFLAPELAARRVDGAAGLGEPLPKEVGQAKLVYLSRIHPVKNLGVALDCLAPLSGEVTYDIYGPVEDTGYWKHCQEKIAALPANIRVTYHGPVDPSDVEAVLSRYHALLLPTQTENHGHVILEALAAGCPVVISDRTPWRGLAEQGVGWDLPLQERDRFTEVLQALVEMGQEQHRRIVEGARQFANRRRDDYRLVEQSRQLFLEALRLSR